MKSLKQKSPQALGIDFLCLILGVVCFFSVYRFYQSRPDTQKTRLQEIARAVSMYLEDSKGYFPIAQNVGDTQKNLVECAARHKETITNAEDVTWNPDLMGKQLSKLENAKHTWCFYFHKPEGYDYYLGFADGTVERMSDQTFRNIVREASE